MYGDQMSKLDKFYARLYTENLLGSKDSKIHDYYLEKYMYGFCLVEYCERPISKVCACEGNNPRCPKHCTYMTHDHCHYDDCIETSKICSESLLCQEHCETPNHFHCTYAYCNKTDLDIHGDSVCSEHVNLPDFLEMHRERGHFLKYFN